MIRAIAAGRERARLYPRLRRPGLDSVLFALALAIFLATRLIGLERFPIYFFSDEAVQTVQASNFIHDGFRDSAGRLFPTYFQNGTYFNLSLSVYAQVIPFKLFGFSVFACRATSVLIALSGTAAVGLILRDAFRLRFWWAGVLLLSITPAWFLHSRTAFETAIALSMYAWFLYFYCRYRLFSPRNLFPALAFLALAFYAYAGTQIVVVVTGVLLSLSDIRYHLRHWRFALGGLVVAAALAVPYVRFQIEQGDEVARQLRTLDSYWVRNDLSLTGKLDRFWDEYRVGLSPHYWFDRDNSRDLVRHRMKGYGFVPWPVAPLILIGLLICILRIRSPAHRALLIATLSAPIGGAIVAVHITRVLILVLPAAVLGGIGLGTVLGSLSRRVGYVILAGPLFLVLATVNLMMLRDALDNGPTWYTDYGLYGMQFGARQVTAAIRATLHEEPETEVLLSPSWTNGADQVFQFLLSGERRVSLGSIDAYRKDQLPISATTLFVMTPEEWQAARTDEKFTGITLGRTVNYPDGRGGFYFVRLSYSPDADAIFARERVERREPVTELIQDHGRPVLVRHSRFDAGQLKDLFDGDTFTLVRTLEANPAVVEMSFSEPLIFSSLEISTGTMRFELTLRFFPEDGAEPAVIVYTLPRLTRDPRVRVELLPPPPPSRTVRMELRDLNANETAHVHVREIALK